ncbi:MAG: hypothetical protein KGH69_04410 [Candidatus Micrarchaeota archaeon]|nr:hypothetical protein [Candidatus Micrarchaeota archaeon]
MMRLGIMGLALLSALIPQLAFSETISAQNYSSAQANLTISNVSSYITMVNSSAYLIFQPNMTVAYSYLNKSKSIVVTSPNQAVVYANLALGAGKAEYSRISYYRTISIPIMVAFTCAIALLLYRFMRPVNSRKR